MIYILIFIIIVIIFLILYLLKTKSISGFFNFNQKIIKGTYTKNKFKYIEEDTETAAKADLNKINVFIGNNPTSSFLKLGGKYLVRAQLVEYYSSMVMLHLFMIVLKQKTKTKFIILYI